MMHQYKILRLSIYSFLVATLAFFGFSFGAKQDAPEYTLETGLDQFSLSVVHADVRAQPTPCCGDDGGNSDDGGDDDDDDDDGPGP